MACLIPWWYKHLNCPICRTEAGFIVNKNGEKVDYTDLPPLEEDPNQPFIPQCELCWGDIEPHEPMNICTECRGVYWHSDCLPTQAEVWYCTRCGGETDG